MLNWTPIVRRGYRVGVPEAGFYAELLNSDAGLYGGSNIGNAGGLDAEAIQQHGHRYSLNLTLPPLAGLVLKRRSSKRGSDVARLGLKRRAGRAAKPRSGGP